MEFELQNSRIDLGLVAWYESPVALYEEYTLNSRHSTYLAKYNKNWENLTFYLPTFSSFWCPPMSANVRLCPPMSAYVRLCPPMSAYVRLCPPMSVYVRLCPVLFGFYETSGHRRTWHPPPPPPPPPHGTLIKHSVASQLSSLRYIKLGWQISWYTNKTFRH